MKITNRTTLESAIDTIADLEVQLRALTAQRDGELNDLRASHDTKIETVKSSIKSTMATIETYILANRQSLFPGTLKSASSTLAHYGFQLGNPTLKTLNRRWTWPKILQNLQDLGLHQFVRIQTDVDKDVIKSADLHESELAQLGMRIDQTERIYVQPKTDNSPRIHP